MKTVVITIVVYRVVSKRYFLIVMQRLMWVISVILESVSTIFFGVTN